MVGRLALASGALASALVAAAPPPRVRQVVIVQNGARSDHVSGDETIAFCRRFQLTAADVRGYFATAASIDQHAFVHDLDQSRCFAAGMLRLKGGQRARWFIDYERRGSLTLATGPTRYFYCLSCRSTRFDQIDEDTRETATALINTVRRRQ